MDFKSRYFLSCLCGSQRRHPTPPPPHGFSKLPMRQSTFFFFVPYRLLFSKLPMRQSTDVHGLLDGLTVSKLPMRQSTAEESERASAPSRENPSPSILPKVSTGRKKSR